MSTQFEEWLESETEFTLKTQREISMAHAAWNAALTMILNLVETVNIKKKGNDHD